MVVHFVLIGLAPLGVVRRVRIRRMRRCYLDGVCRAVCIARLADYRMASKPRDATDRGVDHACGINPISMVHLMDG